MKRKAKIGIFVNADKPLAGEALEILSDFAEKGGIDLFAEPEVVALAGGGSAWTACSAREMADNVSAVAVLGGGLVPGTGTDPDAESGGTDGRDGLVQHAHAVGESQFFIHDGLLLYG